MKNKMLGVSLFCYNISLLVYFLWFENGYIIDHPHSLRSMSPLMYLNAPFFYFYIRNSLKDMDGFQKYDYLHFIPALIHLLELIPFYLLSFEEKQEIAKMIVLNKNLLYYTGSGLIPISFHYLFRLVLQLIYFSYSVYLVHKIRPRLMTLIGKEKLRNWLFISLFLMGAIAICNFFYMIACFFGENQSHLSGAKLIFSGIGTIGILFLNLYINFNPEVVYGYFDRNKDEPQQGMKINPDTQPVISEIKDSELLLEKIRYALNEERLFLNKGITIIDFAKKINVSPKLLSTLINRKFETNFNELINNYRVDYAKELLENNILERYSIEGLANMVGFNSRITFFNVFKKKEGLSPSEYLKSVVISTQSVD
ncbi:helix-turn-helix domain-containing protein [Pedobacter caeni]|uniref:helix-turn-helix domain-containing protein n=1 Tax=Pedobacter caeni TaxID=288992 RepID=UPI0013565A56|nr:helix-turn-helix domain-containing protein [Pedobacter caeni]